MPHSLILETFTNYNSTRKREHRLLEQLLKYNYLIIYNPSVAPGMCRVISGLSHFGWESHKKSNIYCHPELLADDTEFNHLGSTGNPVGLPLAPERARMCTAYLLKSYKPPIGQALTLYFDDVALLTLSTACH